MFNKWAKILFKLCRWRKNNITFISFLLGLVPIAFYVIKFWDNKISSDPSDWAAFGDYIGGIYTLLIPILLYILTNQVKIKYKVELRNKKAIYDIISQVKFLRRSKNRTQSVSKLTRLIYLNQNLLGYQLVEKLNCLADQYLPSDNIEVNSNLEKDILKKLNYIYEQYEPYHN
jgi:hypothetical protein